MWRKKVSKNCIYFLPTCVCCMYGAYQVTHHGSDTQVEYTSLLYTNITVLYTITALGTINYSLYKGKDTFIFCLYQLSSLGLHERLYKLATSSLILVC